MTSLPLRAFLSLAILAAGSLCAEEPVNFSREILPILSNKCFACHGPDTKKAKDLRLDSYAAAIKDRKGIRAIDPESPEDSEILFRIHDKDDPMPPEDEEKQLTEAERALLSRWVKGGGTYGRTDDYGYNIVQADGSPMTPKPGKEKWTPGSVHIHDLNATILHLLGIDHRKLTYRYQGRDFRLTDIHGHVIKDLLL